MKISLINLPLNYEIRWQGNTSIYPPLGLCYIASVLREYGKYDVEIIDAVVLGLSNEQIKKKIEESKPDVVGLACLSSVINKILIQISSIVKEANPNIKTVVGGPYATANDKKLLDENKNIDIILSGEAEFAMLDLVKALDENKSLKNIKGIAYREKGKIIKTETREPLENLDDLPFPAFDLLPDLKLYSPAFRYKRLPMISIATSRGCPHTCIFCSSRVSGYRYHSPEYIFNQFKYFKQLGVKEVAIVDENFALLNKRVEELCDLIIKNNLNITWSCAGVTIASLSGSNIKLIEKMAEAGCWYLAFGLESGNMNVLKNNQATKIQDLENVRKVLKACRKNGITTKGYFILGLPTDTKETINETVNFAKSLPLDTVQFSFPVPYPGTAFYDFAVKSGGTMNLGDYTNMSGHAKDPAYMPVGVSKEWLKERQKRAYREFYFRPGYITYTLFTKVRTLEDVRRYSRQAALYLKKTVLN